MTSGTLPDPTAAILRLPDLVNDDSFLVHRGRFLTVEMVLEVGDVPIHVAIARGRVVACERGPFPLRSYAFAVRGAREAWQQFFLPLPPPGFHDIFALSKRGAFRIEGDLRPLMANLLYLKDVLAAPRRLAAAEL